MALPGYFCPEIFCAMVITSCFGVVMTTSFCWDLQAKNVVLQVQKHAWANTYVVIVLNNTRKYVIIINNINNMG